ncbi:hypothetical protein [Shimia sediminis]|uniref:hypothetical protein n=1 Tax=Shimia sediminis TaxID=2497945 RepID=UPI000F8D2B48|nr:hypothetical protein [Shimia sediminis]
MPLQNRVQPTGEILAHPARGAFLGNRGVLHDDQRQLGKARWKHKAWVCCVTRFKGRRRVPMTPNRYTELFFHDEAVALAAGHRPCCECRRSDFFAFLDAAGHEGKVGAFDAELHAARAVPRVFRQRRHEAMAQDLPDGAFVMTEQGAALISGDAVFPFSPTGYSAAFKRPFGAVTVLTPAPTLTALRNGYLPRIVR